MFGFVTLLLFPTLSLCLTITRIKVEPGLQPAAAALPIAAQVAAAAQAGGIPGARKVVVLKSSMLKGLNQAVVLNKVSYNSMSCVYPVYSPIHSFVHQT